jgi:hypothetical protein
MGTCLSKPPLTVNAGCLFTDSRHVLAGFQPNKHKQIISGFGGKAEQNETIFETAWRETLEELFELPQEQILLLIQEIPNHIQHTKSYTNGNYTVFVYSFEHLLTLLELCEKKHIVSPIYDTFPTELFELILYRKPKPTSEVQQITLLPAAISTIDPYLTQDIHLFLQSKPNIQ